MPCPRSYSPVAGRDADSRVAGQGSGGCIGQSAGSRECGIDCVHRRGDSHVAAAVARYLAIAEATANSRGQVERPTGRPEGQLNIVGASREGDRQRIALLIATVLLWLTASVALGTVSVGAAGAGGGAGGDVTPTGTLVEMEELLYDCVT